MNCANKKQIINNKVMSKLWLSELKFKHVQTIKTRRMAKLKQLYQYLKQLSTSRCNDYHYCTTSFNKPWIQVLRTFKSCWQRVGESRWWESLTVVPAGIFFGQPFHKNNSSSWNKRTVWKQDGCEKELLNCWNL